MAGARMCPNLLQRRLGPGSAARRSAEYQRFSSRTPMESRPLQQIWTTGATADLSEAAGVAPPDRKIIHRAVMRVRDAGTAPPSPSSSPLTPTPSPSPTISPGPRPRDRRCTAPTGCRRRRPGPPSAGPTRTSAPEPPAAPEPAQTRRRSWTTALTVSSRLPGRPEPGPACAMRAQRDAVHPASRRASPARQNPAVLDPRDPPLAQCEPR